MSVFALVDCNSFFCSCEKVFRPDLKNKPVIVLSNNDGCAVARTNEAKALGIKMGVPYFKIKHIVKAHKVTTFSSNFALYADMSQRVMQTLREFSPQMEVYSIDEAFLSFNGMERMDLTKYSHEIKNTVYRYTGIPVSIGIARTKVLAKMANYLAKKHNNLNNVLDLTNPTLLERALKATPVSEIWGVGQKSASKLNSLNINTAWELKNSNPKVIKKHLHLPGERVLRELNEESCIHLDCDEVGRKQILSSRSFGRPVNALDELTQAVSMHTTRVCEKLRRQNSVAQKLTVFLQTNPHKNEPQYYNSKTVHLTSSANSTNILLKNASQALRSIYKKGYLFKKCGVYVSDLSPLKQQQLSLFDSPKQNEKQKNLMLAVDKINAQNGRDTIKLASCGLEQKWGMRSTMRSPAFTTKWHELLNVT